MYKLKNIIKKYVLEKNIDIVIDFLYKNNIKNLNFYNETIIPLNFYKKNQNGGNDNSEYVDVYLEKNKYQIRLYTYTEKGNENNYKIANFIKINSNLNKDNEFNNNDHCGILLIDTKNKESTIQSLNNYKDCVACYYENEKKYKIGDILIQVMIYISINKGMKKIRAHDNSNYNCDGINIPLIVLRTITHGKPYYSKFDFLPLNHNNKNENEYKKNEIQIYNDNNELFKTQPKMEKNELLKIIQYKKFDKNKDKYMLNYINNVIIPRLNEKNNIISDFINEIINDSLIYKKEMKEHHKLNKNKQIKIPDNILCLSSACEFLDNILINIYLKCGYYKYTEKTFELKLEDETIKDYKKKLKLKLINNN